MDKRYTHEQCEKQAQHKWNTELTYAHENNPGQLYSVDTPPPTVSGSLHIGHIFSYTQTDIIARYKRMSGYSVFYPFGFDDNGLPTERYVEKKLDIRAHTLPRSEFIKLCIDESYKARLEFQELWQKMGISADWRYTYSTISDLARRISQESFLRLYQDNHIYRKFEPALYCTTCRTSVAQAELDDTEQPSFFNDIIFTLDDGTELTIGTTRPELLPSCVAVFYHPNDPRYQHLAGKQATVPLFGFAVPLLPDDLVTPEKGTGLVMCCTFGDKTDIVWFKKHNLPYKKSIDFDGKFTTDTAFIGGLKVQEARKKILEELKNNNLLRNQKPITHTVNVHERCKKEIEYIALAQWFLNILDPKEKFIDAANEINWFPEFMKSRYSNWVENLNWDWCLSRQRFYGIPFPVWHCADCKTIIPAALDSLPVDPQETKYPGTCPACSSSNIVPDTDVMDTWNTSSLTPYICAALFHETHEVFDNPETSSFIPMSMRPQAHDIIRTWAFYTIIKTVLHDSKVPWNDIIISGHVLSDSKEKLSKSKGPKQLSPEALLQTYPADAIRYWTASGGLGHDIAFSEGQLKIGLRLITKLWNAFIFVKEHIEAAESTEKPATLAPVNAWLLHQASECFATYQKQLDANEFGAALNTVEQFFWNDFCDNYLELVKHQLFNPHEYDAHTIQGTRYTLYTVGLRILQLYAPFVPYVTETIYETLFEKTYGIKSLHQTKFSALQSEQTNAKVAQEIDLVIKTVGLVRKLKTEHQLSLKVPLSTLHLASAHQGTLDILAAHEQLLKTVVHAQKIAYSLATETPQALNSVQDEWHGHITLGY